MDWRCRKGRGDDCGVSRVGSVFVNMFETRDVSFDNVYKRKTREVGIVVVATRRIWRLFGS
jgi:hypothetical protein